jgi:hypothetical protein
MASRGGRAAGILAGVLYIDDQAGEVFEEDFGGEAGVAAGAAGGDDEIGVLGQQIGDGVERLIAESESGCIEIMVEGASNSFGLLVDLAEHVVRKDARLGLLGHSDNHRIAGAQ